MNGLEVLPIQIYIMSAEKYKPSQLLTVSSELTRLPNSERFPQWSDTLTMLLSSQCTSCSTATYFNFKVSQPRFYLARRKAAFVERTQGLNHLSVFGVRGKINLAFQVFRHKTPDVFDHSSRQTLNTLQVGMVETAKDLGVAIDTSFKPSLQWREGFSRARVVCFTMRRGFAELTPAIFRPIYLAMLRPPTRQCSPGSGAVSPEKI